MSHFSTVKTELRQLEPLVKALEDSAMPPIRGNVQCAATAARPSPLIWPLPVQDGGDIGFRWNSRLVPMSWSPDLDLWKQPIPVERFLSKLTQRYAFNSVLAASNREGFQVAEDV